MSDIAHDWLKVISESARQPVSGHRSAVPSRKMPVADNAWEFQDDGDGPTDPVYRKLSRVHAREGEPSDGLTTSEQHDDGTPLRVIAFGAGSVLFGIGIILLLACLFTSNSNVKLGASTLLAAGSLMVALAVLRGQDVDERSE